MNFQPALRGLVLFTGLLWCAVAYTNGEQPVYEKATDKPLADILEDIDFALTEQNLRIVDHLHIGQTIRSRGTENFPDYEVITYCSLTFAKEMLELEPELINACPGRITVRQTGDSFIISAPLWPEQGNKPELNKLMHNMNKLVRKIVDFAAAGWLETEK